jgi:hypothetical protein
MNSRTALQFFSIFKVAPDCRGSAFARLTRRLLICASLGLCLWPSASTAETIYGVTIFRDLIKFDSADPATILSTTPITGLTGQSEFESVRHIDFRPATGQLYAIGNAPGGIYRLYTIDLSTGVATRVGPNLTPPGNSFGFNFNPVTDQIRIVNDSDQNFRLDPNTGTIVDGDAGTAGTQLDTALAYPSGDPNFGSNPNVVTGSYSNSVAGAVNTALYDIDSIKAILVQQSPSNSGMLFTLGPLGIAMSNYIDGLNLDISPSSGIAYLSVSDPGAPQSTLLYSVNLNTGAATLKGPVGPSSTVLNGIAIPLPPAAALPKIALITKTGPSLPGGRIRFTAQTDPGVSVRLQFTAIPADEGSWTDVPDGNGGKMTENDPTNPGAGNYTLVTTAYLYFNGLSFRAISSKSGFVDGKSDILGPYDLTVPQPPAHGGLSQTIFTVNEKSTPSANVADTVLRFAAIQTGFPKDLAVRVQKNVTDPNNEGAWSDLENRRGGHMLRDVAGHQFFLSSSNYPLKDGVYFRAISSAQGYPDSISNFVGPFSLPASDHRLPPITFSVIGNSHVADLLFLAHEPFGELLATGTARVQSSTTPADEHSWTDLNPSEMQPTVDFNELAADYTLAVNNPPAGQGLYFRAVSIRSDSVDIISNACGPFDLASDFPPVVTIDSKPAGLPGSGDGHDADHPIIVSTNTFHFGASAGSNRPIKSLKLQYDGRTVAEFGPGVSSGSTNYTPSVIGDHTLEAVAIDDLGAKTRAGTAPVHIRVVADGSSSALDATSAEPLSPSAAEASGKTFSVVTDNGNWTSSSTWRDRNNQPGVPGPADIAIIGSKTVKFNPTENVGSAKAVSINGGRITGPATLNVTMGGQMSIGQAGATFDNMTVYIRENAACALLNASHIVFNGGEIFNFGTVNVHGAGGVVGTNQFVNYGMVNWLTPISIPPNPQSNPAAIARPMPITSQHGAFTSNYTVKLIGEDGASLIGQDGASLISDKGGAIISDAGAGLIGHDGATLIGHDGATFITDDGAGVVTHNGGNLIGTGVGSFHPALQSDRLVSRRSSTANEDVFTFTQDAGETNLEGIGIIGNVVINGGSLTGSGVIAGNVTNKSFIVPGHSAGTIQILGDFTQEAQGTLVIENGGAKPADYDQIQVAGAATLNGKLEIRNINGYIPDPADTFSPLGFASASGSLSTSSNTQVTVNGNGLLATVNPNVPGPSRGQPLNIATRLQIQSGENVLIAGFIITGPPGSTKQVLIRGIGPSLANFGVPGTIPDPLLELHQPGGGVVTNDHWQQAGNAAQIPNGFAPSNALESAIYTSLAPGAYTAILKGAHGETGVGLVEVYDFETSSAAKLANIATRGFVNTGDNVMIGGFIVGGTQPANVLVRAIGPSLTAFGVQGALQDTSLELHDQNGTGVISNDDWRSTQEAQIIATTIPPSNDRESAILATLVPGNYTAIVRGANDTTGIALIEAYNLQ